MYNINPLKTQLNPICHFLALLGAHPILHVSRIRVNMVCVKCSLRCSVCYRVNWYLRCHIFIVIFQSVWNSL